MIENSIKQFRARRNSSRRVDTNTATKQRLGLAQREIANSQYETRRMLQQGQEAIEAQYSPADAVGGWADQIAALSAERQDANRIPENEERSTTGALSTVDGPTRPVARWDGVVGMSGGTGGRAGAEEYLGRSMSDTEWEYLTRTTYAETTGDPTEQAAAMSVILNRVLADNYPDTVTDVVLQPNQFQAVTGTSAEPGPSGRFRSMGDDVLALFETDVTPLLGNFKENNWLNFTAGNAAAYGPGTDLDFRDDVNNAEGSAAIGGTIFGTVR